ncbi:MAG: hypothetical protein CMF46_01825 [Legionellales bacterium]|nr:hypothetical protein [Legionellales bacterium]|tara:strand:- start:3126 stop:3752 length:627 start_codon:yes stop_codon:yes gene_type:complete
MKTYGLILLHGLGADSTDMSALSEVLIEGLDVDVRVYCPSAPIRSVTINHGMLMPSWYDLYQLDTLEQEDTVGIQEACEELTQLLDEVTQDIPADHLFIGGFSQGAALALYTALRYPHRLAGVLLLSGYCPLLSSTADEQKHGDLCILQTHGTNDDVLPETLAQITQEALTHLGHNIETVTHHDGHGIGQSALVAAQSWLKGVIDSKH